MSQPLSSQSPNIKTILFMVVLSFICALILSVVASALQEPQKIAKELDRSKQMLIAAKILDYEGYFLLPDKEGEYQPAKYIGDGILEPGSKNDFATNTEIIEVYKKRIIPLLVNDKGDIVTFEKSGLKLEKYVDEYKEEGYYKQPLKLIYKILPNPSSDQSEEEDAVGYVIPVNGFGLWGPIYGYLAIKPDGNTVIGISWYEHVETPGLGANIAEEDWQSQFPGKKIYQYTGESPDYKTDALGIIVVKGKVEEVIGSGPKAKTAVDGMAGATLTGNGVTDAYKEVLAAYRPFFIMLHQKQEKSNDER